MNVSDANRFATFGFYTGCNRMRELCSTHTHIFMLELRARTLLFVLWPGTLTLAGICWPHAKLWRRYDYVFVFENAYELVVVVGAHVRRSWPSCSVAVAVFVSQTLELPEVAELVIVIVIAYA